MMICKALLTKYENIRIMHILNTYWNYADKPICEKALATS
jgi:hypothetical protein